VFRRIAISALFAGGAAGAIAGALQLVFVQPILRHAELYESGQLVHFGESTVSAAQDVLGMDLMRDGLSIIFSMAVYIGYAFLLAAAIALAEEKGHSVSVRHGLLWGLSGFVATQLAPGFSMAPEVPGVAAAEIVDRQIWWFVTVAMAAVALWLIGFGKSWRMWSLAILLLAAPHLIGAPQPDSFAGPVPPELGSLFVVRALGVGLVAWVLTGLFVSYFMKHEHAGAT
jgi:cobalt transporter subunit CbtA